MLLSHGGGVRVGAGKKVLRPIKATGKQQVAMFRRTVFSWRCSYLLCTSWPHSSSSSGSR